MTATDPRRVEGDELRALRADQTGAFMRPPEVLTAFEQHGLGQIDDQQLRAVQTAAMARAIAAQERIGMPVVTDGEYFHLTFQDRLVESVTGFDAPPNTWQYMQARAAATAGTAATKLAIDLQAVGPAVLTRRPARERIRLVRNWPLQDYLAAQAETTRPVKMTLIGPDRVAQRFDVEGSAGVYDDLDAFVADIVAVERSIVGELAEAGCRYVQLDEPGYTGYVDEPTLDAMRSRGEDPAENLRRSIAADNAVVEGFDGITFGIHVCRGNERGRWHREGTYAAIAEELFAGLAHDRLLLEYDDERAGGFEPLRFVPPGKVAVLGLVSTKTDRLETVDELRRRLDDAARYLPYDQLAISPQCGFPTGVMSEDTQWRKLEVVLRTAEAVWGSG